MSDEQKQEETAKDADLKKQLEECEKEKNEYLSGWQRAKADFINYKKEEVERLREIAKYANEDLMRDLVTVLDNFDLGIAALERQGSVEKGVYMIRSSLEDVLRKRGLEKISHKPGDAFDPSVAEGIGETTSDQPPGTVAEEIEPGYRLEGKVVRPARVKLSKGKS